MKKKAIIIGLDGVRPDCLLKAKTPNIDSLLPNSKFSWHAMSEIATVSGPAWTAMLTGVHMDKHNVPDNNFKDRNMYHKTIFSIAKSMNPNIKTVAYSHWKPIITKIFEKGTMDEKGSGPDKRMAERISMAIKKDKGDIYFIQLDDVDGAGHRHTYSVDSENYLKAIEVADEHVGRILSAINNRPDDEDWLIIVASDHGGEGKSHGAPVMGCLSIVFIVSNKNLSEKGEIVGEEEDAPNLSDIVPTIAEHMGIPKQENWDGKSYL